MYFAWGCVAISRASRAAGASVAYLSLPRVCPRSHLLGNEVNFAANCVFTSLLFQILFRRTTLEHACHRSRILRVIALWPPRQGVAFLFNNSSHISFLEGVLGSLSKNSTAKRKIITDTPSIVTITTVSVTAISFHKIIVAV